MALSTRVSQMHRRAIEWLGAERAYAEGAGSDAGSASAEDVASALARRLPTNSALELAAETLHAGWRAMNDDDARVLMVVQPCERNVFDQRMIEAALWERHGVKTIRATLREIASDAVVAEDDAKTLTYRGARVSVVYYRAGYAPTDYPSEAEWDARLLLERSGAVKSPSAAMHLAGTKKVQQTLASPGGLERFVECEEDVRAMRSVFAGLYALDGEDAAAAVELGLNTPESYVLKPQREGGGNNLYGEALRAQLAKFTPDAPIGSDGDLSSFILMQRILPPVNRTLCLRNGEMQELETLSELGIYGGYLRVGEDVAMNVVGGHLLRTKAASSDEGGVAAGYAVLDSPCLTFT
jgi:glutathione synthase